MNTAPQDERSLSETLDALRAEVARLGERVATLELALPKGPSVKSAPTLTSDISTGTLAAISAALAAYLGVTPRIRQIRLLTEPTGRSRGA